MMKKLNNIPSMAIPVMALVVIASLLLIFESDFLWKIQEENLFLNSRLFFNEQMLEPGGFLTWVGTWFTQFFFYPWFGVLMLCAWWLLLMWLIKKTFRVNGRWMPVTIIPVLFLLVTIVDMGYWIYILKLRGHVFLATIGTTAAMALLWAFRLISERSVALCNDKSPLTKAKLLKSKLLVALFPLLTCVIGYPLLGIYGLGATLLMAVWIWRLEKNRLTALAVSLTGLLSVWLLPLFFYRFVYYQTNVANIYVAKLPLYYVQEEYSSYYVPYLLLITFFVVMSVVSKRPSNPSSPTPIPSLQEGEKMPRKKKKAASKVTSPHTARKEAGVGQMGTMGLLRLFGLFLLLALAAYYTYSNWYRDENYHHELAMQRCIDRLDWEGVLEEAAKQDDQPTRAIVMMRNLALARLGRQGDEMYHYKNGCKKCDAPFDIRAINSVGPLIYYHYGMPNYGYRLCMERGVEFGWRAEQLKYMVRCSIISGEMQLARKYLSLLRQTMYHDTWADEFWQFTEHPENIAKSPETEFITHMMHYTDKLSADNNLMENFLMKCLTQSKYTDDPIFVEQKIYAAMQAKDPSLFWSHLHSYVQHYPDRPLPLHVQEAAYLFGKLEGLTNLDNMPVNPAVRESYKRFDTTAPRYEGLDLEDAQKALYPLFGNTYFYDYFLVIFPAQN